MTKEKIKNLQDLMNTKGFFDTITTPVNISRGELLLMLLKFSLMNHACLTEMSKLFRLINAIFVKPILPESRYMLNMILNPDNNTELYGCCPKCGNCLGKLGEVDENVVCNICQNQTDLSTPSCENLFAVLDTSKSISDIINSHEDYYNNIVKERVYEENHMKDIYDGKMYRDFVSALPKEDRDRYVTLTLNTDGAPVFKSSKYSIWPVYLMINEIPVQERFSKIVTCCLWFNKIKPSMETFLYPLVNQINNFSRDGIECTIQGEVRKLKLFILLCCVDTVARAPVLGKMQFNAHFGCDWCEHPGEWHTGSMRYPVLFETPRKRDKETTINYMMQVESMENPTPIYGIKTVSPLINLPQFDIINGFVPDYMHCCLLGVARQITSYLINKCDISLIDDLIKRIKVPHVVSRLSRPFSDRNYWKAREWENWILYYSVPILASKINSEMLNYWTLFVESLYICLQTDINDADLNRADEMLHIFVFKTQQYFGKTAMTYNVHQLLHLVKSVYNWGPLWSHSAFAFESGNHQLLQAIHCAKGVILQILRFININSSTFVLEKKVYPTACEIVRNYCITIRKTPVQKSYKLINITYFGKEKKISIEQANQFGVSDDSRVYYRMVKDGCLYASCLRPNLRSDNSFALLKDNRRIKIHEFIVDIKSKTEITTCEEIQGFSHNFGSYHFLEKVKCTNNTTVLAVPTEDIKFICVFSNIDEEEFIVPVPNLYYY